MKTASDNLDTLIIGAGSIGINVDKIVEECIDQEPTQEVYNPNDGFAEMKRSGNNRKHVKRYHAKIRKKIAKKSKRVNRKK